MAKKKTLFSTFDLYNMADRIMEMYTKFNVILKLAKAEKNQLKIDAYSGIVWELDLLIKAYGIKEMIKIN